VAVQVEPQSIPAGVDLTEPVPVPLLVTPSEYLVPAPLLLPLLLLLLLPPLLLLLLPPLLLLPLPPLLLLLLLLPLPPLLLLLLPLPLPPPVTASEVNVGRKLVPVAVPQNPREIDPPAGMLAL
jgi:hypothetical protein